MERIGITTTVPIEILMAAGYQPVDLNNLFITDQDPGRLVAIAERAGFPLTCCTWIKGIYGACHQHGIKAVLGVTSGDCSNTLVLMEVLRDEGLTVIPFAFPYRPDTAVLRRSLESLAEGLGTNLSAAEEVRQHLAGARRLAHSLDQMTWREGTVGGWENHLWLVSSSDFNGDPARYAHDLQELIAVCQRRTPYPPDEIRLAFLGVPPIFAFDLYRYLEQHSARVVFNEIQRQFAMPLPGESLSEQYSNYTYPYPVEGRLRDIATEVRRRRVEGVIHYVQAFCHHEIEDILVRKSMGLPILRLQGNDQFVLDSAPRTRIEAFLDLLRRRRVQSHPKGEVKV